MMFSPYAVGLPPKELREEMIIALETYWIIGGKT